MKLILQNDLGETLFQTKQINWNPILKCLILKRAYKGYVHYNKLDIEERKSNGEDINYYNLKDFSKLEYWKIRLSFKIYLEKIKKIKLLPNDFSNRMVLENIFN